MCKKILAIAGIMFCLAFAAKAQEAKGLWAGAFEASDVFAAIGVNFDESKVVLRFAGNEQTGALKDLQIKDGKVSFLAETRPRARFTGAFDGEKISGTIDVLRSDGSREQGVWSVRKVDSFDFKDESNPVSTDEKIELPKPSGNFAVGRKLFYWTDETRAETITEDANDKRKLFVQLWYPASKAGVTAAEYYPNVEQLQGKNEYSSMLAALKIHATTDARIAKSKRKFPVIVFSPGLSSSPFSYTAMIENLVSRGYVVAAINHPYDSGDFVFSGGEVIRFDTEKWDRKVSKEWTNEQRKQFFDERRLGWARDVSFVVDQLQKLEKPFKDKLDFQNLGLFGHSFGGQATTIACASDTRFKACANLDGMAQGNVYLPDAGGKIMKQPFLFFSKAQEASNADLKMMNLSRQEYQVRERRRLTEKWQPAFKSRLAELESGAYVALYSGVNHSSFGDALLLNTKPNEPLYAERFNAARRINEYVLQFFDKFLMKKSVPLFDQPNEADSPVIVEFLKKPKTETRPN